MLRAALCLAFLVACGCQGDQLAPPSGPCTPTCAGGPVTPEFADYETARKAFTRQSDDEVLMATLEDASWLRFEGDPETVEKAHGAYFEYGYTSFAVVLRSKAFTQPSKEQFLLEDSQGGRVAGKPVSYTGGLKPVGDRWEYGFNLSFKHAITKDLRWLKLTRLADGASVEWAFPQ